MDLPEKRQLYMALPAFAVAAVIGYSFGATPPDEFDTSLDLEINATEPVGTASFDGRNLTVMYQDDAEARFFLDVTGDGSSDREIDTVSDGDVHQLTEIVTLDGKTYFISMRYSDDPERTGDAWMRVYRATEV